MRFELVDVLVEWLSGINLVLDAVEARHHHGRKSQIGIAGWIWRAELEAFGLRALRINGDAHRSRAIALRISEVDRRFVTGDQALVRVCFRPSECYDCRGVLSQTSRIPRRHLRKPAIALAP